MSPASPPTMRSRHFKNLLHRLAREHGSNPLLCWQEGAFTVAVAAIFNRYRFELQLPTTHKTNAKYWWRDTVQTGVRQHSVADGSGDLTVTRPFVRYFEIKTRPDLGAKAQAAFKGIADDLDRVSKSTDGAFLFAFDEKIYASFDSSVVRKRSQDGQDCNNFFPPAKDMTVGQIQASTPIWRGVKMQVWATKCVVTGGTHRVFVAGQPLQRPHTSTSG